MVHIVYIWLQSGSTYGAVQLQLPNNNRVIARPFAEATSQHVLAEKYTTLVKVIYFDLTFWRHLLPGAGTK